MTSNTNLSEDAYLPTQPGSEESSSFSKDVSMEWEKDSKVFAHAIPSYSEGRLSSLKIGESNSPHASGTSKNSAINLENLIELLPIKIEKPWGKEIWFTGIEKRGISLAGSKNSPVRISTLHKILGEKFLENSSEQPILLKILAPNDHSDLGNLYYELHTEKQEVYIVSKVSDIWSNGTGKMKYGISSEKLSSYDSEASFKSDFLKAVKDYESIRAEIESKLSQLRTDRNCGQNDPLPSSITEEFYKSLPSELVKKESEAKEHVESFVGWKELKLGDVVSVETHVPHSLQHGIEVIEFQTPVYERFIISFDQKVLTQSHWDVENAFDVMKLKTPESNSLPILTESEQFKEEEVVNFSDFKVSRVTISESYRLSTNNKHALVYVLKGQVVSASNSSSFELKQGAAYYALPDLGNINLKALEEPSVVLIASPH